MVIRGALALALLALAHAVVCCAPDSEQKGSRELATPRPSAPRTAFTGGTGREWPTLAGPIDLQGGGQSSSAIVVSSDDRAVIGVNPDSDSVTLVDAATDRVIAEIPVGDDPRTVALAGVARALVANHGGNSISVIDLAARQVAMEIPVGHRPYGVVVDGNEAYVSHFGDRTLRVIDHTTGATVAVVDLPDAPAGLALASNMLLITHFFTARLSVVDTTDYRLLGVVPTEVDGNLARFVAVDARGERLYVPQTRSFASNENRQFDSMLFPIVSVLAPPDLAVVWRSRITLDTADRPVNMPYAVAFSPDGGHLFVVHAGSDAVSVIDLATNLAVASVEVGANPRGIVVTSDGRRAYTNNVLEGTFSVIDTRTFRVVRTIAVTEIPLSPEVLAGKRLFHTAATPRLSKDGWISCNACHFDGGVDRRTWFFPDGPRNTPPAWLAEATLPHHWSGTFDEIQDVEDTIRRVMAGTGLIDGEANPVDGLPNAGRSSDLDALAAFLASLEPPPSPYRRPDGSLSQSALRGQMIFMSGSPGCDCHPPPLYTDLETHDLAQPATAAERRSMAFDTPSLIGLWATAPYMHDGRAASLREALTDTDPVHRVAGYLPESQLDDLINFLLSLPGGLRPEP